MIVISVDFGQKGLAYCVADAAQYPPVIRALTLLPDTGKINTAERAVRVAVSLYRGMPPADVYVLEAQPAINRMTLMLECALAAAIAIGAPSARVVHLSVASVKREFALPTGHNAKKLAATDVACTLLRNATETLIGSPDVLTCMIESPRRHDMADAMLMAMWYARKVNGRLKHGLTRKTTLPAVAASSDVYRPANKKRKRLVVTKRRKK